MAPQLHSAIRLAADHSAVVVEHVVVSAAVEITTTALQFPVVIRLVLALSCLLTHWQVRLHRHT